VFAVLKKCGDTLFCLSRKIREKREENGNMMKDVIIDLLRSDGSIVVNKRLAKAIGLMEAVVYSEIVSLYKYWASRGGLVDGEWFFCTDEKLSENTTIPERTVRRKVAELVKLGLIEKELKGLPAKIHYRITDKIFEILGLWPTKDGQNGQPDKINVSSDKNAEKPHGYQVGQNGQPRMTNLANQEWPNWSPNNTNLNNTNLNNTNLNNTNHHHPLIEGFNQQQSNLIHEFFEKHAIDDDDLKNKLLEKLKGKRFKYMAYIEKTFETVKNMVESNSSKEQTIGKQVRKELIPDWLKMDYNQPKDDEDFDIEQARRELEERLKKYRDE